MSATPTTRFGPREFKTAAIRAVAAASAAVRRIRVDDEVFRKLRMQMVATDATRATLDEALTVIMRQMAERATSRNVRYSQVIDLVRGAAGDSTTEEVSANETSGETGWVADAPLAATPTWDVRAVLDRFKGADGIWYCVVEWENSTEPAARIPRNLIAAFDRKRRALVRDTYIE